MTERNSRYPKFTSIHVDCDPLVYKYGFAAEENTYLIDEFDFKEKKKANEYCDRMGIPRDKIVTEKAVGPVGFALFQIERKIRNFRNLFGASRVYLYLSPRVNFRNHIWDEYKANRIGMPKPVHYDKIRDFFLSNNARIVEGYEADDIVSISHFNIFKKSLGKPNPSTVRESLIIGEDKDFNNVPGWHYNFAKDKLFYVTVRDAVRHFYLQMLMGDTADNVEGIKGIGEKKAIKLLPPNTRDEKVLWSAIREIYLEDGKKKGISEKDTLTKMLINAHMLWILWEKDKFFVPPIEEDVCLSSELLEKMRFQKES